MLGGQAQGRSKLTLKAERQRVGELGLGARKKNVLKFNMLTRTLCKQIYLVKIKKDEVACHY